MWRYLVFLVALVIVPQTLSAQPADLEEQARRIAAELRCPVCQNLSAGDSPAELAQQMRAIILEQLKEGKTPEEIRAYFVSKYGEWVLLAPSPKGFSRLLWILPYVALFAGILFVAFLVVRWVRRTKSQTQSVDPALVERVQREVALDETNISGAGSEGEPSSLLEERARLYTDLKELEFDYQAGKISQADYQELRHEIETQAALVLKELQSQESRRPPVQQKPDLKPKSETKQVETTRKKKDEERVPRPAWQLAVGGLVLLVFGVTLGVLLTQSMRPRTSEQDSITGGFLTGTGSQDVPSLIAQGRAAYEKQDWGKAIESFKKVLAVDGNNPEAHSYMGMILIQANHPDGALSAFDRALAADPNFGLALWGKGMLLYREKQNPAGAREALEKLVKILPPGQDRENVQKTLGEIAQAKKQTASANTKSKSATAPASASTSQAPVEGSRVSATGATAAATGSIQGTISLDPKLKAKTDGQAVLFIMARSGNSGTGSLLAVKRIDRPVFPLTYSLGPESVMMQNAQFAGKVNLSVRLDKDGNPMTKGPGDLLGDYKKNPVQVGSQKIDVVIDQAM
ncbi:MAG: cytochrome c-type biogenesis protein CcmH [Deltaproteobacteria bacterium]|nr:cytochrome c-type biogenesis protein CcmH [Deltaproteobacteria bacterium]